MSNLLVLSDRFPCPKIDSISSIFVKEQVDELTKHFDKIVVVALIPWIPKVLQSFAGNRKQLANLYDYEYDNVQVHYLKYPLLPNQWLKNNVCIHLASVRLLWWLRHQPFDLILSHFSFPSGVAGIQAKKRFVKPCVIVLHENKQWLLKESKQRFFQEVWNKADILFRVNRSDLNLLKQYNPNTFYLPNGFNPSKFYSIPKNKARKHLGLPIKQKILFSLGGLIPRKGFEYLIPAVKSLDAKLFVGGRGNQTKLQKLIDSEGLTDKVKLLGELSSSELVYWMNASDLFVLPSLSESFGIVALEAMACGVPVVTTRNGGTEKFVNSSVGIVCEPASSYELEQAIQIALAKKWNVKHIVQHARKFTWANITKKLMELYYLGLEEKRLCQ